MDKVYVIFILHLGRIYSSLPFVLLIKYQSRSSCYSLNCSYLTHIGLQTLLNPFVFSTGISGLSHCLGPSRDAGLALHPMASPNSLGVFICRMPVLAATKSGFISDFKHLLRQQWE